MMRLLPSASKQDVAQKSGSLFSSRLENRVIFLVGSPTKKMSESAADVFFHSIDNKLIFKHITYLTNTQEQMAWGHFYFPYRLSLFSPSQQQLLRNHHSEQIVKSALFALYSPTSLVNSNMLATDPYFTFFHFITTLPRPASNVNLLHERMMVHYHNRWYVMLTATLRENSFSINAQNKATQLITAGKAKMLSAYPRVDLLKTGYLFFAKSGSDTAQQDISTIGIGSVVGIILLMLITFRSISPIIFTLLSGALGFVSAFVLTSWLFGKLFLFTLIFGASLIGICVDYAFFYYAEQLTGGKEWKPREGLRNIFRAISLGLLNLLLAYFIMVLTPIPGLKQLAVFAIVGLFVSYATVVCAFPYLLKAKKYIFYSLTQKITDKYLSLWKKVTPKILVMIYISFAVLSAIGIMQLHINDDIHQLESMPAHLLNADRTIQKAIGSQFGKTFYVVTGNSSDETLTHVNQLSKQLDKTFNNNSQSYLAINAFVPPVSSQYLNFQLNKKTLLAKKILIFFKKIGVSKQKAIAIQRQLLSIKFKPLTINEWMNSTVSKSLRFLWLGKVDHQYASIVMLAQGLNIQTLEKIAAHNKFVTYVNNEKNVSQIFKLYREKISLLLVFIYLAIALLLSWRYGLKKGFIYFLPNLSSGLLSLGFMGLLGIPLTLFSVLALVLVSGISMDYVLFFVETKTTDQSTILAVTLSAITTLLSFGLLSLSSTPVVHFFGTTLFIGILSAFILAPSVIIARDKK